jgi:cytochrome b
VPGSAGARAEIRVWDPFVRLFHWGTVALVTVCFLSADAKWLHEPVGYAVLALAVLRVLWGIVGTRHARFSDFIVSPRAVAEYLRGLWRGSPRRYVGHNPAGGVMVVLLLTLLLVAGVSGWMTETDRWFGVPWVDHLHHRSAHLLLLLVGVHLAGVLVSSWLHRENLLRAMLTGRKPASEAAPAE